MKILLFVFVIFSTNVFGKICEKDLLEDLLISREDIFSDFLETHAKTIESLHARGIIDRFDIKVQDIVYARNIENRSAVYIIQSKQDTIAFD